MTNHFLSILKVSVVCFITLTSIHGQAQTTYPNKPIKLVITWPVGGFADTLGRALATQMSTLLGQQVVVENRGGANGMIGADVVAKSAPDGYTLMVIHNAIAINQTLYPKLPYDAVRDFAQVALVGVTTNTLVVHPALPVKNTKELIALAKSKPDALNYASTGAGGTSHLAMEYFRLSTGTKIVHIPYKGTAPALTDMVAGQTQVMISALPGTVPFINAKRLIALATSGAKRSVFLPNLPTLAEAGVKDYEFDTWYGMHAPIKVPRDIIVRLNQEMLKALQLPDIKERMASLGADIVGALEIARLLGCGTLANEGFDARGVAALHDLACIGWDASAQDDHLLGTEASAPLILTGEACQDFCIRSGEPDAVTLDGGLAALLVDGLVLVDAHQRAHHRHPAGFAAQGVAGTYRQRLEQRLETQTRGISDLGPAGAVQQRAAEPVQIPDPDIRLGHGLHHGAAHPHVPLTQGGGDRHRKRRAV